MLLAFSPFLAFLALSHLLGLLPGLCAGAAAAVVLLVRDRLRGARETDVLALGTAILFAGLALVAATWPGIAWSVGLVRLVVDGGLMLVLLAGTALGRPFAPTRPREGVTPAPAVARSRESRQADVLVSMAWALAFGVLALADLLAMLRPAWPLVVPVALGAAGLAATMRFTRRTARWLAG